jgi:Arc/MetJ family transcription regulator
MRTTLDIPERLLREAQRLLKSRTKSAAVTEALRAAVRRKRLEHLLSLQGKVAIEDVTDELERAELKDAARTR